MDVYSLLILFALERVRDVCDEVLHLLISVLSDIRWPLNSLSWMQSYYLMSFCFIIFYRTGDNGAS
jgi:hypothetical protein